jgi:AraC-like DNA-binding protein
MSPSTFRQHFRALTGLSPSQYQKQLRLQEARQLMLNQNLDASSAAGQVGYESASQFSPEYSRLFGDPLQRDIKRTRLQQRLVEVGLLDTERPARVERHSGTRSRGSCVCRRARHRSRRR